MARLRLLTNSRGVPFRLVAEGLGPTAFKRVAALPGATVQANEGRKFLDRAVTFALEPERVIDIQAIEDGCSVMPDAEAWLRAQLRWERESLAIRETPGDTWDVSAVPFGSALYPYQRTGVAWLRQARRGILGDEMGLGKTLQGLGAAFDADPTLVITVGLAERSVWQAHLTRYLPATPVYVVDGDRAQRVATLRKFVDEGRHGVVIINHDMLQERFKVPYRVLYLTEWSAVLADEAHLFQDHRSSRSRGAASLQTQRLYLLTGTPVWNRPESAFGLLHLLSPRRWSSYWTFVADYCDVVETYWSREIVGIKPGAMERLQRVLAPYVLRRVTTDPVVNAQLPALRVQTITYDLEPAQARAYRALRDQYQILDEQGDVVAMSSSASKAFADMRRLVNDPSLLDLNLPGAKARVLSDLLDEALSEDKKVVLFTWHRDYTRLLQANLLGAGIRAVAIDGSLSQADREFALRAFQTMEHVKVLVASIATSGTAIDLTAASVAIFAEGSYVTAHVEQAIKRLHRHGQTVDTMIYRLQARGTVEEALWATVDDRVAQASEVLAFRHVSERLLALKAIDHDC